MKLFLEDEYYKTLDMNVFTFINIIYLAYLPYKSKRGLLYLVH